MVRDLDLQRLLDLVGAGAALTILSPWMPSAAALILLEDGAPVLFSQRRVGQRRGHFVLHKLRTMRHGQITRVGRLLRATGLDEVPQLWNVLRGEMCLVGPRPMQAEDVTRLGWEDPRFDPRFSVKPGLTGLVQIFGTTSGPRSQRIEQVYREHRCLALDLQLVGITGLAVLLGRDRARRLLRRVTGTGQPMTALGRVARAVYATAESPR